MANVLNPAYNDLGVRVRDEIGTLRVWSGSATAVAANVFDTHNPDSIADTVHLQNIGDGIWEGSSPALRVGAEYVLHVDGPESPTNRFDPSLALLDPYSRGLNADSTRSVVVADDFDWAGSQKPNTPWDQTVVYEAHVKGLSKRHPALPPELQGTYAGAAHETMIAYYKSLGITAIEFLPIHAFATEDRLIEQGRANYWGYNSLNFFTPHARYATASAQQAGPAGVLREFKGMVKLLHEAGIEIILDVVYNHTAEGGIGGSTSSLRGIDNANYYRQDADGNYIDTTGCGNSVNTATDAAARLVLDSLRYWANEVQIDGFRFDLATELARNEHHEYTPEHPLLQAIAGDPALAGVKLIAEPWDVGMGGWQTGNFPDGWHEWNDRYRDRVRNFWLVDIKDAREHGHAPTGIGSFATRLAGSSNTFSAERGPLASINFVTAHDGFTLHDLTAYDHKHNEANGEENRDGNDNNRSFNHGVEGDTDNGEILATRRKAMRNVLGTLLLSAGVPMLTAGDEIGRTQHGNNNAYNQDSEMTWLPWNLEPWQNDLLQHARALTAVRLGNAALRPAHFAVLGEHTPGASQMDWFDQTGQPISVELWQDPSHRTLQYLATEQVPVENNHPVREPNRVLLIVHGEENQQGIVLPASDGITRYVPLWSSTDETPSDDHAPRSPGDVFVAGPTSMHLFRAETG